MRAKGGVVGLSFRTRPGGLARGAIMSFASFMMSAALYAVEIADLQGRWNMDVETIRALLASEHQYDAGKIDETIKSLLADDSRGRDVIFGEGRLSFMYEERKVIGYTFRIVTRADGMQVIEIGKIGSPQSVAIIDLTGDRLVLRDVADRKMAYFRAYKRAPRPAGEPAGK